MSEVIKMDYSSMEDMSKVFKQAAQELDDLKQRMEKTATGLNDGALIGDAGDGFAAGIREALCPALERLSAKMTELSGDIWGALVDLRDEDHEAQSRFKG